MAQNGIFEMLNSPVAQGLLAGGLGAMASRGSTMQALGRGGLLGMQVYGQAAGQQQNRLIEEAKKLQQQQALASLKPREGGGFTTDRMADLLQFMKPDEIQTALNLGRDKFKQMQEVTNADGSKSLYGVNEFGGINSTGLTNAPEIKTQDLGGTVVGVNPYTGQQAWDAQKTATIAELEAQRHNRASEGIQRGNLEVSRSRLAMEKAQEGNGYTFNAELGGYIPKNPGGDFVPLTGVTTNPKLTESEAKNSLYLGQMREASGVFDKTQSSPVGIAMTNSTLTNWASPQNNQVAAQAQRQWSEAYLRAKTGAAATAQEVDINIRTYFPMPGDSPETVKRKAEARAAAERDMELTAGRGASRVSGSKPSTEPAKPNRQIIRTGTLNGRKVVQYSDGSTAYAD